LDEVGDAEEAGAAEEGEVKPWTIRIKRRRRKQSSDLLTTTAEAIGSTLGKLAVKTGIAKPPGRPARPRPKPAKKKAPTKKAAAQAGRKAATKRKSPKKPARGKQKK
jgi:hypothetical protein